MKSKYKDIEIKIKKKLSQDFLGLFNSTFKWLWTEFDSLREYVPWDSVKSIDWKTTAKYQDVFVKNFEEQKEMKALFLIDNSESFDFWSEYLTKRDTLKDVFYLLSYSCLNSWFSLWAYVWNKYINYKKNKENIYRILDFIDNTNSNIDIFDWIDLKIRNNLIFILTDKTDFDIQLFKYLSKDNELIIINIFDYLENNLIEENIEFNVFWESFLNIVLWDSHKVNKYKKIRDIKLAKIKSKLRKNKLEYLNLDNRDDIFLSFYKFFKSYKL